MVTRAQAASKMANLQPFKGTLNASGDPESEEGYTVSSYNTPIARVTRQPGTGTFQVSHSNQHFSPTTTQHQNIARRSLPGQEGTPLGEQRWTRQAPARSERYGMPTGSVAHAQRMTAQFGPPSERLSGGPDMGHGMLISELLPELFNDRRQNPVNRRPTR